MRIKAEQYVQMQSIWANEDNYRKIFWSKILNFTWMHFHEYFIWLIPWINILFTISICFVHPWANKAYPDQTLSDLSLLFTVSIGFVHAWANNADPDQTLFDLSLHCLLRSVYPNFYGKYGSVMSIQIFRANVFIDQMPYFAASDLGLHSLLRPHHRPR